MSFSETEDGRLLLALSGVCRFEIGRELDLAQGGYRRVSSIFAPYRADWTPPTSRSSSTASG